VTEKNSRRTSWAVDDKASETIKKIEEVGARCDALEASKQYLAAQLTEVNKAWHDAIAAIAASNREMAESCGEIFREIATQSSGSRQQIFLEMAELMEAAASEKP